MNAGATRVVTTAEHLCEAAFSKASKTITLPGDGYRFVRFPIDLTWRENKHVSSIPNVSAHLVACPSHNEARDVPHAFGIWSFVPK